MGAGVLVGSEWDADGDEQDVGYRQVHDEKVGSIPHLASVEVTDSILFCLFTIKDQC